MTKEELIKHLKLCAEYHVVPSVEAFKMVIKLLEQQSSEDCVSRQAVINLINEDWKYEGLELSVKELPPVTPTRKQGKWDKGYGFPDGAYWKCSCCNELIKVRYPMNYCPNCGADMRGTENG